jgi:hypothetical protein
MEAVLDSAGITEDEKVEAWRLHVLIEAGYPIADAEELAANLAVDLHRAVALLKSGCAPELAFEILI